MYVCVIDCVCVFVCVCVCVCMFHLGHLAYKTMSLEGKLTVSYVVHRCPILGGRTLLLLLEVKGYLMSVEVKL